MDSSAYSEGWYAWATPKGNRPGHEVRENMNTTLHLVPELAAGRCSDHPAFEADYCPLCGTARVIGAGR